MQRPPVEEIRKLAFVTPNDSRSLCDWIVHLERQRDDLLAALSELFKPAHRDGCLWLADRRMPCQCGATERINKATDRAKELIREFRAPSVKGSEGSQDA